MVLQLHLWNILQVTATSHGQFTLHMKAHTFRA